MNKRRRRRLKGWPSKVTQMSQQELTQLATKILKQELPKEHPAHPDRQARTLAQDLKRHYK